MCLSKTALFFKISPLKRSPFQLLSEHCSESIPLKYSVSHQRVSLLIVLEMPGYTWILANLSFRVRPAWPDAPANPASPDNTPPQGSPLECLTAQF